MQRNAKCNCNSGKKYKKCCLYKDQKWYKNADDNWEKRTSFTTKAKLTSDSPVWTF